MSNGDDDPRPGARAEEQASPENTYAEFRLRIERGTSRRSYRIVASGPSGQVEGRFKLPFSDLELENFVLKVGGTRKGVRSLESPEMDLAKAFGGKLFDALFGTEIRGLYRASTVEATNAGQGLRITLALTSVPELLRVPWEYLYDRPSFPSTDRRTPIVRYLDLPKPIKPFQIQLPLRILAIVSAPTDAEPIDASQERSKLEEALAPLKKVGAVAIDWLEEANLAALYRLLSSKDRPPYHILHFIGHGGYVNEAKQGVLLFEDKDGRRKGETGDKLGAILHVEDSLRLAVLNSCEGARASLSDPFSSVATGLIEHEIPAVIGMQFEITDRAAILFSGEFYAALADGRAVDESLSQARMAIFADNNDIEWGTPVLFMRVTDGRLFDVQASPRVEPPPPAAEQERKRLETERRRRLPVLAAVATLVGAGLLAFLLIFVLPGPVASIEVSVPPGGASDVVQVTGTGFEPGEVVNLDIDSAIVGTATATENGTISTSITVPAGARSPVEVSAVGRTSGRSASGSFALAAGGPASPEPTADGSAEPSESPVGAPTLPPSASTAPTPIPILFYAVRLDPATSVANADLYAINPSTGVERRLTHDARPDSFPARSPDGTRVVFDSRRGDGNRNIWVLEADGSFTPLTDDARDDGYPAWSPDGGQVAWAAGLAGQREIWVMSSLDGSGGRQLTTGADDLLPSWSSSGLIAFERHVGSSSEIWVVDPAGGGAAARITAADGGGSDPAWSPDGQRLAFTRQVDGIDRIFVVDADGQSGVRQLTPTSTCDCEDPTWSPDGSQIAYVGPGAHGGVVRPILVIAASGGSARRVTTNGLAPSWGG